MSGSDPSKSRPVYRAIGPELGRALRTARQEAGLSVSALSVVTGLAPSFLRHLEHGQSAPSMRTVLLLAAALELPADVERALREFAAPPGRPVKSWTIVAVPVSSSSSRRLRRRLRRARTRRTPEVIFRALPAGHGRLRAWAGLSPWKGIYHRGEDA